MIMCRGDSQATVGTLAGGFGFLFSELKEVSNRVSSHIDALASCMFAQPYDESEYGDDGEDGFYTEGDHNQDNAGRATLCGRASEFPMHGDSRFGLSRQQTFDVCESST